MYFSVPALDQLISKEVSKSHVGSDVSHCGFDFRTTGARWPSTRVHRGCAITLTYGSLAQLPFQSIAIRSWPDTTLTSSFPAMSASELLSGVHLYSNETKPRTRRRAFSGFPRSATVFRFHAL